MFFIKVSAGEDGVNPPFPFNMFTEKSPTSKRSVGGRGSSALLAFVLVVNHAASVRSVMNNEKNKP
jgi:hypothetical protein